MYTVQVDAAQPTLISFRINPYKYDIVEDQKPR